MEQSFGAQLRRLRRDAGLTQQGLGELAGLSDQAIRLLEHGERRYPQPATVNRLMDALKLDQPTRTALLNAIPKRDNRPKPPPASDAPSQNWTVSQQLPLVPTHFSGRDAEFNEACQALTATPAASGSLPVVAIHGMAGVGKSALAAAVAAEIADQFPDGQLYLNLGGFGPSPSLRESEALYSLLRATGVADSEVPVNSAEASSLLRSRLFGRRVLIVLDNASDIEQVSPLLPAAPTCAVLVISRVWLTRLPANCHLQLDVLDESTALQLLRSVVGPDRVDAEPDATAELIRICAGLPLAIQIAAGRLVAQPAWLVEHLVDRLRNEQHRLDELAVEDATVRASLAVSFGRDDDAPAPAGDLSEAAFAALGLIDATSLTAVAAARLIGKEQRAAQGVLERMVDANLLMAPGPARYQLHDLLHLYARELADQRWSPADQNQALDRLLDVYETMAWRTTRIAEPMSFGLHWEKPDDPEIEPTITDAAALFRWLTSEHDTIVKLATQLSADSTSRVNRLASLVIGLGHYFLAGGRFIDFATLVQQALQGTSQQDLQAILHCYLGIAQAELGQPDQALASFHTASSGFVEAGYPLGEGVSLNNASRLLSESGRFVEAIATAERALKVNMTIGNAKAANLSLNNLGASHCQLGAFETGYDYFIQSLELCSESGDQIGRALALHNVGCASMDMGRLDEAVRNLEQSAELSKRTGMRLNLCNLLIDLSDAYGRLSDTKNAIHTGEEALAIAITADDPVRQGRANLQLGRVYANSADPELAREHLEDALALFEPRNKGAAKQVRQILDGLPQQ
ncbi:tetratricopeptide repeat protein [Kribbella sp. NPDC006257]|uniref:ATP-binding protein n=1 Tax=Kribbella sp. NPDC006257 TaxID=3156738 RepID=UPI0033A71C06